MQLRTLGIASLLRSTMRTQRTCGFGRRQRLRTPRRGDFTFVSTPPRQPDPADETVVIDETSREMVEEEVVPPRRPPRIWPWLLALLLLVLGGLAAYLLIVRDDDKTVVPKVVGLTETQARTRLAEEELEMDVDRRPSDKKAGIVFAQSPGQGVQLNEGQTVEVLVSSGLTKVPVPNVIGLKEAEAVERLETAKFEAKVERVFAAAPKGEVVDQQPKSGEQVATGSVVTVKVSKGTNTKPVPDVIGLQEDEAISTLRDSGFEPRVFDVPASDPVGTVVAQEPQPGAKAPPDSSVRINVSTGEPTGETTERPGTTTPTTTGSAQVTVSNVVGIAQTPALRRLRAAGLRGVVAYRTSDQPRGRVLEQSPAASGSANRNAQVRIVVAVPQGAEEVEVPDVRDQDEDSARQTLEDLGFTVQIIRTGEGDTVEDQQPAPGVTSARGMVVTLFVG
jgi:beta-lactam-binding protein with PASTA domain